MNFYDLDYCRECGENPVSHQEDYCEDCIAYLQQRWRNIEKRRLVAKENKYKNVSDTQRLLKNIPV